MGGFVKLYDAKVVARFLDMTDRRVRQLRDEGVISEARPGLYDLTETNRKYIRYLRERNPDDDGAIDYRREQVLLVRAKRRDVEFDLQVKENQLHRTEDVERVMSNMLINFKARLMAIPSKLSPTLSKKTKQAEIFALLKAAIDEALRELADFPTLFREEATEDEESDS